MVIEFWHQQIFIVLVCSLLRTLAASKGPLHTAVPSNGTLVANVLAACPSISVQSSMKVSRAVLDGDTWRLHGTPGGSKDERLLGTFQALLMATHATGIPGDWGMKHAVRLTCVACQFPSVGLHHFVIRWSFCDLP